MIQVNLRKLLQKLENDAGIKLSISELSRKTGIHRTILSKLNNELNQTVSSDVLDSLINYSFRVLRSADPDADFLNPNWQLSDKELISSLLNTLISVFPGHSYIERDLEPHLEKSKYTKLVPLEDNTERMVPIVVLREIPFDKLWEFHEKLHPDQKAYWKNILNREQAEKIKLDEHLKSDIEPEIAALLKFRKENLSPRDVNSEGEEPPNQSSDRTKKKSVKGKKAKKS